MAPRKEPSPYSLAPFGGFSRRGVYGRPWGTFFSDLWHEIVDHRVIDGAAALGFYLTLAIFPMLIFLLGLLPYLPIHDLPKTVMEGLFQVLPGDTATMLQDTVQGVVARKHQGLLSLGALLTLWAASSGTYSLMQQLDTTYGVVDRRSYARARLTAIALLAGFGILTIVSFAVVMLGDAVEYRLAEAIPWWTGLLAFGYQAARWLFTLMALSAAFSITYYFGPDVEQEFRFVTPGSAFAVVTFLATSLLFKAYVAHFGNYNATYGGIGAVIVLMLWLNILGLVTLVGSELNALLEHYSGHGKEKGEHAPGEPETRTAVPA
jgi:membrane protein